MNINQYLRKKIVPLTIILFLALLTIGTSAIGITKVVSAFDTRPPASKIDPFGNIPEPKDQKNNQNNKDQQTTGGKKVALAAATTKQIAKKPVFPTINNSTTLTPTPTPMSSSNGSGNCIVTLFGKQYDVTSLRSTHPGGDIFNCGTDMSATYQSVHGTNVDRMKPYLITTTTSGSNNSGNTSNNTSNSGNSSSGSSSSNGGTTGKCIITLFGKQYDVTSLQSPNPGGTFACGTDMSAAYQSVHGTDVTMMQPYLVTTSSNNNNGSSQTGGSSVSHHNHENDDDDDSERDDDD